MINGIKIGTRVRSNGERVITVNGRTAGDAHGVISSRVWGRTPEDGNTVHALLTLVDTYPNGHEHAGENVKFYASNTVFADAARDVYAQMIDFRAQQSNVTMEPADGVNLADVKASTVAGIERFAQTMAPGAVIGAERETLTWGNGEQENAITVDWRTATPGNRNVMVTVRWAFVSVNVRVRTGFTVHYADLPAAAGVAAIREVIVGLMADVDTDENVDIDGLHKSAIIENQWREKGIFAGARVSAPHRGMMADITRVRMTMRGMDVFGRLADGSELHTAAHHVVAVPVDMDAAHGEAIAEDGARGRAGFAQRAEKRARMERESLVNAILSPAENAVRVNLAENYMALNNVMEFDHVIIVHADGSVSDARPVADIIAPDMEGDPETGNGVLYADGWELMSGYTSQMGGGNVMHNSEFIGGEIAHDILHNPGVYVAVACSWPTGPDDDENDDTVEGWGVAFRSDLDIPEIAACADCGRLLGYKADDVKGEPVCYPCAETYDDHGDGCKCISVFLDGERHGNHKITRQDIEREQQSECDSLIP